MSLQSTFSSYRARPTNSLLNSHTDSQPSIRRRTIYIPPDSESESEHEEGQGGEWEEREELVGMGDEDYNESGAREEPVGLDDAEDEERREREESVALPDEEGDERGGRQQSVALLDVDADERGGRQQSVALLDSDEELESLGSPLTSYPRQTHLPAVSPPPYPLRAEETKHLQAPQEHQAHLEDQDGLLLSDEEDFEQAIDTLRLGSPPTTHWKRREVGNDHHDHTNAYASAHANANANTNVNADDADDDDGDVLAMLLQRQQKMRENQSREDSEQVGTLVESGLPQESESESSRLRESQNSNASVDRVEDTIDSPAHRRAQALLFLESIPLNFFADIRDSLGTLNRRDQLRKVTTKKAASRKKRKVPDDEDAEGVDVDMDEGEGGNNGKGRDGVTMQQVRVTMRLKNRKTGMDQVVSFPNDPLSVNNKEPAMHRMACIMTVSSLRYEAILTDTVTTKRCGRRRSKPLIGLPEFEYAYWNRRDMYYKHVELFKTQAVVDKLVDDLVATAGLRRQDFNVCATSKGLVASSSLRVHLKSGEQLSLSATNASLIPPIERISHVSATQGLDWVLVVEKDAVFQTLCSAGLLEDERLGPGAVITGKGYPDLATLQLLSLIAKTFSRAGIHVLVDADPHGIDILSVYTNGSRSTKFSHDHAGLALGRRCQWMGVRASEWLKLGVAHDSLLQLTAKDVQKATSMLRDRTDMPPQWRRELVQMLFLNRTAEIQILCGASSDPVQNVLEGLFGVQGSVMDRDDPGSHRGGEVGKNGLIEYVVERLR